MVCTGSTLVSMVEEIKDTLNKVHDKLCSLKFTFSVVHMVFSIIALVINKEAHDKLCGLRFTLNVVRMVFDIITSGMMFDTIKLDVMTEHTVIRGKMACFGRSWRQSHRRSSGEFHICRV